MSVCPESVKRPGIWREKAIRRSSLVGWMRIWCSWRSAGCLERAALSSVMSFEMPIGSASAQRRGRNSYFSLSLGSSKEPRGVFSTNSYPEYTPHVGEPSAASIARIAKMAVPPSHICGVRMSWVVGQNVGRMRCAVCVETSSRYSSISCL